MLRQRRGWKSVYSSIWEHFQVLLWGLRLPPVLLWGTVLMVACSTSEVLAGLGVPVY